MSDHPTLMSKLSDWFKRPRTDDSNLPTVLDADHPVRRDTSTGGLLRPWAKRDNAMESMTRGFDTLTNLMGGIRENLERQGSRQEELLGHLSRLPAMFEQLPEASRVQGETLKALHEQLSAQHQQQHRLVEILDHVSRSGTQQNEALEDLSERVERMRQTDQAIADNLNNVGSAMAELGRSTSTGAQVLENLRDNIHVRDDEIQQVLLKQGARFTVMLSVAIFLSIAALVAVAIVGYLMLKKGA